jgi:hypothetical protein
MYEEEPEPTGMQVLVGWILVITFILTILTSTYLITAVAYNDYVIVELQTFTEDFESKGYIPSEAVDLSDDLGESYQVWIYNSNRIFILMYVIFFVESLVLAYFTKRVNYFSFFGILLYGIMILLFLMSIFLNLSKWFLNDFLAKLIPPTLTIIPSFAWFLNYSGIILAVQLGLCLLINQLDLDLARLLSRKQKERSTLSDSEI